MKSELLNESQTIINYVYWVINNPITDTENTIPLLYTKSYGVLYPSRVLELIENGVIVIINHEKIAA